MRILQITLIFIFFTACQKNTSQNEAPSEVSKTISDGTSQKENVVQQQKITNGIVFRDAQGNLLSDAQKDSIVQYVENIQALRRFDDENNNTEYILFQNYEDLKGFVPDETIENLIEENRLRRSGGQGAVTND